MKKNWGFDTREIDTRIPPQNDFYHYVNQRWMQKNPIPPEESSWGSFLILRYNTEKQLHALVKKIVSRKQLPVGSPEQMVRDFYLSSSNMKRRNQLGVQPILPWLQKIESIHDIRSLVNLFAYFEKVGGGSGPWGLGIDQDMKNSEVYKIYVHQSGLSLPDRDYYLKNDAESLRVRTAYEKHIEALSMLLGDTAEGAAEVRKTVMKVETAIAKISMTKEDLRDVDKTYHKMTIAALERHTPHIDWQAYFAFVGAKGVKDVIVMQPKFLKAIDRMLTAIAISDWRTYARWHVINGSANVLSEAFEKQSFAFYGTTLSGVTMMKPLWRRALRSVNGALGEPLGKLYVDAYFGPEAKKRIVEIVADLFTAYEARIKNLDWMSAATKKKALKKLGEMNRKFGYPDKWRSYKGLRIAADDYFGNILRTTAFDHKRALARLRKPVDRGEWFMTPQTVNAYCSFGLNDIVFPAAILQAPFFSKDADDALNYGGIGTVIGHEITHGFDDQGAKFDGKGNRKTWWTAQDRARFDAKAKVLVKQFNEYTVADGLKVNGQLTLGENIADLGGASIAYDAFKLRLAKTGRKTIDGYTPEQRFFLGFALFERENRRPEAEKIQVLTDPHSPGIFRINGPASNLPEFYEAFGVTSKHKLYREQKERAKIW